jgi:putative permease
LSLLKVISSWLDRYFANEQTLALLLFLGLVFFALIYFGVVLAPLMSGLVGAFLLNGVANKLERYRMSRMIAVLICLVIFLLVIFFFGLLVVPVLVSQLRDLIQLLPSSFSAFQLLLTQFSAEYPDFVTPEQVTSFAEQGLKEIGNLSRVLVETLFSQVSSILGMLVYMVLTPLSLFFFLKDKELMISWLETRLPENRELFQQVGGEMNAQLGNYVRGKTIEIVAVGLVTWITFAIFGLKYSAILGALVGLSVLIPFLGAAVVTIPVFLVGLIQFGWGFDFAMLMFFYALIQFLDGNVLVPLLFSEVNDLHPIAIIFAVLFFGGLWGVWGVFFAIPLATLIKAVFKAWPVASR